MTGKYREAGDAPRPELEQLARQGRAARSNAADTATDEARSSGDRHLREALAAIHGAPTNVAVKAAAGLCLMSALLMILLHESVPAPVGIVTLAVGIILAISGGIMPAKASDQALQEEQGWSRSHPFALEGYFEVLSVTPRESGGVRAHVTWAAEGPAIDEQLLADAFAAADPEARLESVDDAGAVFASGVIRGETGARINREPVLRNHHYPEYIHNLVSKVLVPLAKSYPIESVRLEAV